MRFTARKKQRSDKPLRLAAILLIVAGLILGIFDGPHIADRLIEKTGLGRVASFRFTNSKFNIPYRLGLDIQGGTHLVYRADVKNIASGEQASALAGVRDVIERRVNLFGVSEPLVQVEKSGGDWRLIVELAGVTDVNAAIKLIGETPFLEFREERPQEEREAIQKDIENGGPRKNEDPNFVPTPLTGRYLQKATLDFGQTGAQPEIGLELTEEGGRLFAELTKKNIGKLIAIYLDGAPISAPVVQEEITGGRARITGSFTPASAKELVGRLNAGALPVPITLIVQERVGASLGIESLRRSLFAGLIGFLAVALFMILWYRVPGVLAVIALLLYVVTLLALFKIIPVTLTIAGIAGVILSIGMAVDANILIFERTKEELKNGKSLEEAVNEGFARAWTSIRDSNVSSLITAVILYGLGTSVVKGFALTLVVGILVSMFSAISVTRVFLLLTVKSPLRRYKWLFASGLPK